MFLPDIDTTLGKNSAHRPLKPTAGHLLAPILHVLGERTSYRPRVFVPTLTPPAPRHDILKDEILRVAGFNPDDNALLPIPLHGTSNPAGFYRKIWLAVQEHSVGFNAYRPRKKATPIFVKDPLKG